MLDPGDGTGLLFIQFRQRIVEVHPAACDVAQKIAHQLDTHWLRLSRQMQHSGDQTWHFIGEVPTEEGRFEANNHYLSYKLEDRDRRRKRRPSFF
jgi:hypothetical protein